eukprot:508926-Rhodomonas_salina.1
MVVVLAWAYVVRECGVLRSERGVCGTADGTPRHVMLKWSLGIMNGIKRPVLSLRHVWYCVRLVQYSLRPVQYSLRSVQYSLRRVQYALRSTDAGSSATRRSTSGALCIATSSPKTSS